MPLIPISVTRTYSGLEWGSEDRMKELMRLSVVEQGQTRAGGRGEGDGTGRGPRSTPSSGLTLR